MLGASLIQGRLRRQTGQDDTLQRNPTVATVGVAPAVVAQHALMVVFVVGVPRLHLDGLLPRLQPAVLPNVHAAIIAPGVKTISSTATRIRAAPSKTASRLHAGGTLPRHADWLWYLTCRRRRDRFDACGFMTMLLFRSGPTEDWLLVPLQPTTLRPMPAAILGPLSGGGESSVVVPASRGCTVLS